MWVCIRGWLSCRSNFKRSNSVWRRPNKRHVDGSSAHHSKRAHELGLRWAGVGQKADLLETSAELHADVTQLEDQVQQLTEEQGAQQDFYESTISEQLDLVRTALLANLRTITLSCSSFVANARCLLCLPCDHV